MASGVPSRSVQGFGGRRRRRSGRRRRQHPGGVAASPRSPAARPGGSARGAPVGGAGSSGAGVAGEGAPGASGAAAAAADRCWASAVTAARRSGPGWRVALGQFAVGGRGVGGGQRAQGGRAQRIGRAPIGHHRRRPAGDRRWPPARAPPRPAPPPRDRARSPTPAPRPPGGRRSRRACAALAARTAGIGRREQRGQRRRQLFWTAALAARWPVPPGRHGDPRPPAPARLPRVALQRQGQRRRRAATRRIRRPCRPSASARNRPASSSVLAQSGSGPLTRVPSGLQRHVPPRCAAVAAPRR